ncbi:MAG: response regulator [Propionivibrio sp.]
MTSSHTDALEETIPLTCFLVEDSDVIRENLIATLQELLPIKVLGAAADVPGAIAWMHGNDQRCDFMIIDIFLKIGTGFDVLVQARALVPDAKRIVLTNFATQDVRNRCLELGADAIFDKSSELEQMMQYCESLQA